MGRSESGTSGPETGIARLLSSLHEAECGSEQPAHEPQNDPKRPHLPASFALAAASIASSCSTVNEITASLAFGFGLPRRS